MDNSLSTKRSKILNLDFLSQFCRLMDMPSFYHQTLWTKTGDHPTHDDQITQVERELGTNISFRQENKSPDTKNVFYHNIKFK